MKVTAAIGFTIWLFVIISTIVGLFKAFSASIILGIIVLFITPAAFVLGVGEMFSPNELCLAIATWAGFPV